jgi:peptidoglycan/LPS O-acetylase OafA/YrhL
MNRPATAVTWIAVIAALSAVVVFSLGPDPFPDLGSGIGPAIVERIPHAVAYAALTGLILLAWRPRRREGRRWLRVAMLSVGMLAIGVALELGQAVVDRDADPYDVLANAAGVGVAVGVWAATATRGGDGSEGPDRSVRTSHERGVRTGNGPLPRGDHVVK